MRIRSAGLICFGIFISGCVTVNKMGTHNLSYLYEEKTNFCDLKFTTYHISKSKTRVYYDVKLSGFLYERGSADNNFQSQFKISYELYDSFKSATLIDSGSFYFLDSLYFGLDRYFSGEFDVKTVYPGEFVLTVSVDDLSRPMNYATFKELNNTSEYSRENFIMLSDLDEVKYEHYINDDEYFRIRTNNKEFSKFFVRYYQRDFPIALPPFQDDERTVFRYRADSVFEVDITTGYTDLIKLNDPGFYHFQVDSTSRDGITVFRYDNDFPRITRSEQMLEPLKYLTTKKEYDEIKSKPDPKDAVDDFWIRNSGNKVRARVMIQKYYTRIQDANIYFTSYLEGWKTDRGIIYIVYGTPSIVYRDTNYEQWIYGEEGNMMSITFNFIKVNNPFTDNDFLLDKSPAYKESWYLSVNNWRR